jgi:hypothetical protein
MKAAFVLSAVASGLLIGGALVLTTASVLPAAVQAPIADR